MLSIHFVHFYRKSTSNQIKYIEKLLQNHISHGVGGSFEDSDATVPPF
jgi:hypothetical protein